MKAQNIISDLIARGYNAERSIRLTREEMVSLCKAIAALDTVEIYKEGAA